MMSQNRQEAKDRQRAENDYIVNLKNELIIDDLHKKLGRVLENEKHLLKKIEELEKQEHIPQADKDNGSNT